MLVSERRRQRVLCVGFRGVHVQADIGKLWSNDCAMTHVNEELSGIIQISGVASSACNAVEETWYADRGLDSNVARTFLPE